MFIRKENKKKWIILFVSEILVLIPKIIVVIQALPIADGKDEMAMLAVPAKLAGFDWSQCMAEARYYGFGYFFVFAPLFRMNMNMLWIYRIILLITAVLEGIIPIIIQYILDKYFRITSAKEVILITTIMSFMTVNPLYNLINEHALVIIIWGVTLIAFNLVYAETKRSKQFNTILLDILLIYGLFIHTRFQVLIIAVCITAILYKLLYKEWLVAPVFFPLLGGGYILSKYIIRMVQIYVWGTTNLLNASVKIPNIEKINLHGLLEGFFRIILGNIGTLIIFTASSGIFVVGALLYYFFLYGTKRKNKKYDKAVLVILCIFFLSLCGTLAAFGLMHMKAFAIQAEGEKFAEIKALTYLRYYLIYFIPVFFIGLVFFYKHISIYKKTYKITCLFSIIILLLWINYVAPYVSDTNYGRSTFYPFSYLLNLTTKLKIDDFRAIIIIIVSVMTLTIIFLRKNRTNLLFFLACLFIYQYIYFAVKIAIPDEKRYYRSVDASIDYVERYLDKEQLIYIYDNNERYTSYRVYLYQYKIAVGLPDAFDNNVIILTNKNIDDEVPGNMNSLEIDNNEWIYYTLSSE